MIDMPIESVFVPLSSRLNDLVDHVKLEVFMEPVVTDEPGCFHNEPQQPVLKFLHDLPVTDGGAAPHGQNTSRLI